MSNAIEKEVEKQIKKVLSTGSVLENAVEKEVKKIINSGSILDAALAKVIKNTESETMKGLRSFATTQTTTAIAENEKSILKTVNKMIKDDTPELLKQIKPLLPGVVTPLVNPIITKIEGKINTIISKAIANDKQLVQGLQPIIVNVIKDLAILAGIAIYAPLIIFFVLIVILLISKGILTIFQAIVFTIVLLVLWACVFGGIYLYEKNNIDDKKNLGGLFSLFGSTLNKNTSSYTSQLQKEIESITI